ncbi:MAG: NAD(+) diphosphatase [Spirochaetales bacterium]|jgi:NAD+ diphosphatase|nr:NAD(+) diphosphatase [Spirochaetales bacterium]
MKFLPRHDVSKNTPGEGHWFLFQKDKLVTLPAKDSSLGVPRQDGRGPDSAQNALKNLIKKTVYLGTLDGTDCYAGSLSAEAALPDGYACEALRPLYGRLPQDIMNTARFAIHLMHWDRNTRFCGVCGTQVDDKKEERAKVCPACKTLFYPRIAPAVIVAILDGKKILLAHNRKFINSVYSLVAGFIEIGETAEECIEREIMEEVGLRVKNIRYFGSQPWPFPDSLMLGFTAEYAGGEVRADGEELVDARWFCPPDMPELPSGDSIARKIITWYENVHLRS